MRKVFFIFLLLCALIPCALAGNFTELIEYDQSTTDAITPAYTGENTGGYADFLSFKAIENYDNIQVIEVLEEGTNYFSSGVSSSGTFIVKYDDLSVVLGTGSFSFVSSSDGKHDRLVYYFDSWNNYAYTGNAYCTITYSPTNCNPSLSAKYGMTYQISPCIGKSFNNVIPGVIHQTTYLTPFKGMLYVNTTPFMNGSVDITSLYFNRLVDGVGYPSTIDVRSTDGASIFINANYSPYGDSKFTYIDRYPTDITVTFGYPIEVYEWFKQITGSNPEYNITEPTVSPTATPTPDISPTLCGYWTFAVNASNIARNDYVTGTLTESDPDNKHKQIDWYLVLPSGQEVIQEHFVYDEGFFGFGAGWVNVNPYSGVATVSSEAAAKSVSFDFPTVGKQYMRVKIYEDKSLLPAAYHDYNLFCTQSQVIYVADTTQGTGQFAVNVYESGTNTLISGVTVHLFDYATGEWYNKSASTGGTIYYNVVPGHEHRILVDETYWNTYDEDYTMPNPVPSQPYAIYLIRPMPEIVGASYARFYVKDGSTYQAIYGASIALSDGQVKATLPSGFAEFNVTDGVPYYYTVSKTGYEGQTGTFNISIDTVLPTVFLFPKAVMTTPTTIPYWTQTPTPLTTYPNGTVIPGQTIQPTITATLNIVEREASLVEATDVWYRNATFLSNLLFLCVILGIFGLMSKSFGGGGSGRRRNR